MIQWWVHFGCAAALKENIIIYNRIIIIKQSTKISKFEYMGPLSDTIVK